MKRYILLYDSGKGGKNVLEVFKKVFPNENFLLFCDKKNAPFGNKREDELEKILFSALFSLTKKYPIKAIVIACNTMSSLFKREVKKIYPNSFFVEPKINKKLLAKNTLVLATKSTIRNNKKLKFYENFSTYHALALPSLATKIDNTKNMNTLLPYLKKKLLHYLYCENIILACTHYTCLKPQLAQVFPHPIFFYDSALSCAKKLLKKGL